MNPHRLNGVPEFRFTFEEDAWITQIYDTTKKCTRNMIRPVVYQAMIDVWRGARSYGQLLGVLAEGKSCQAYMHIIIMANLPYFKDLSSK